MPEYIDRTTFVDQTSRKAPLVHKALKYLLKSIFLELFLPLACIPLRPFLNTFTNFSLHILYKKCFLICVVSPGVSKFSLILLLKNNLYKSACTSFRGFPRMAAPSTCNHRNNIIVTSILKVSKGAKIRNRPNQVPHLTRFSTEFCHM